MIRKWATGLLGLFQTYGETSLPDADAVRSHQLCQSSTWWYGGAVFQTQIGREPCFQLQMGTVKQ
jgi:hypothetical protein